ncbi:HK97 family phage prohead protease [Nocardia terpenica]|uniref:HK97 family phage prohead protease n=1 Tax=Nocardia terpenica TaxID=455432 RepID=UPI0009EE977F|nr:HK97 family phage prohead protease [Nocardia terpenica]NQE88515.1 HK97 family phage prohead protease [Nocardia terpenica]
MFGGPAAGGFSEIVAPGAFDRTLKERADVHLLINHDGMPLARTKSGTLRLGADSTGLQVEADLDRRDPDVQRLETKMARGDMDEMSFAFRVKDDVWSQDQTERRITEISLHKGDVSVMNFGANPATTASLRAVSLRSVLEVLSRTGFESMLAEARAVGPDRIGDAHELLARLHHELHPTSTPEPVVAEQPTAPEPTPEAAPEPQPVATPLKRTLRLAELITLGNGTDLK